MNAGMIIIGFPGIGKSSVANMNSGKLTKCIDLESSNFNIEGTTKPDDWEKIYANIAYHLAQQGKIVFVSSHNLVHIAIMEKRLKFPVLQEIPVMVIFPSPTIKEYWLLRLKDRINKSADTAEYNKNLAAYEAAEKFYDQWVTDLENRNYSNTLLYGKNVYARELFSTVYKLEDIIEEFDSIYGKLEEAKDTSERMLDSLKGKFSNIKYQEEK